MISYFILLLLVVLLTFTAQKVKKNQILYYPTIFFIFLLLVLFAGLRDQSVGTDTSHYIYYFQLDKTANEGIFEFTSSLEVGYQVLQKIARSISDEYWIILTLTAMIVVFFYVKTIWTLSENYLISIFVFISLATYLFFFNGARQGIAAAIFSFSIIAVIKGDYKKYYFWVFVAFLFHKSVLVTLPFYYLLRQKFSLKNVSILLSVLFVIVFFSFGLITLLSEDTALKYKQYIDEGYSGGLLMTAFYSLLLPFFIIMRRYISGSKKRVYDIYLNMATVFTSIYVFVSILELDVNFFRLTLYFSLGMILLWPMVFKHINQYIRLLVYLLFITGHLMFFYSYLTKISDLSPYSVSFNFYGV